jgi:hypothetical protein
MKDMMSKAEHLPGYEGMRPRAGIYLLIPNETEHTEQNGVIIPSSNTSYDKKDDKLITVPTNEGIVVARGDGWTEDSFKPGAVVVFPSQFGRKQYVPSLKKDVIVIQESHIDMVLV